MGVGYFFVWTVLEWLLFAGVELSAKEMQQPELARSVSIAVGVVFLIAGSLSSPGVEARHLAWCREAPNRARTLPTDAVTAWRHGLRLGLHCSHCCFGLMAILLAIGVMDLRAMAFVAQPSPSSVSHRPVSPSREPSGPSSWQGCFRSREQPGSDDASHRAAFASTAFSGATACVA